MVTDWVSLLSLGAEKQPQEAPYMCENVLRVHRLSFYNKPGFFYCQGKKTGKRGKKMQKKRKKGTCRLQNVRRNCFFFFFMEGLAGLSRGWQVPGPRIKVRRKC